MKKLLLSFGILAIAGANNLALAQREAPNRREIRQQRRENMQDMTPEQRRAYFENRFQERLKSATPEQRQRMIERRQQMNERFQEAGIDPNDPDAWQKLRELGGAGGEGGGRNGGGNASARDESRRQLMIAAGITDRATQDAIIAFVNEQEKAREPLLALAREAASALKTAPLQTVAAENGDAAPVEVDAAPETGAEGAVPTGAEIEDKLVAFETAAAQERIRSAQALQDLDAEIGFSKDARLRSFLTLAGIAGVAAPDSLLLGGVGAVLVPTLMQPEGGEDRGPRQARNRGGNQEGGREE